jgi:hypothetical protein
MRSCVSYLRQHKGKLLTGEGLHGSYALPVNREVGTLMTQADYRHMATEIRELIPLLVHPQAIADLRLLAARYEKLAEHLEATPETPWLRRQAG